MSVDFSQYTLETFLQHYLQRMIYKHTPSQILSLSSTPIFNFPAFSRGRFVKYIMARLFDEGTPFSDRKRALSDQVTVQFTHVPCQFHAAELRFIVVLQTGVTDCVCTVDTRMTLEPGWRDRRHFRLRGCANCRFLLRRK